MYRSVLRIIRVPVNIDDRLICKQFFVLFIDFFQAPEVNRIHAKNEICRCSAVGLVHLILGKPIMAYPRFDNEIKFVSLNVVADFFNGPILVIQGNDEVFA